MALRPEDFLLAAQPEEDAPADLAAKIIELTNRVEDLEFYNNESREQHNRYQGILERQLKQWDTRDDLVSRSSQAAVRREHERVLEDLRSQARDCRQRGWDGYDGEPVDIETLSIAERLVQALPYGVSMPTTGADPDGHLTLEWYRSTDQVLSVSVSPKNMLYYAAILGDSRANGAEPFLGQLPDEIRNLIRRVELG